jgi:uncharacterized OB-fold protein
MAHPDLDRPAVDPVYEPFYAAASSGQVVLPHCDQCGRWHWYPQSVCPHCHGERWTWQRVHGPARAFSWTTVHRAFAPQLRDKVPFTIVLVEFDDAPGVRLLTNLSGSDPSVLAIGQELSLVFGHPVDSMSMLPLVEPLEMAGVVHQDARYLSEAGA